MLLSGSIFFAGGLNLINDNTFVPSVLCHNHWKK